MKESNWKIALMCHRINDAGRGSGERVAQFAAEDFSRGRAGEGVDEADFAGLLVVGEAAGDKIAKLLVEGGGRREAFADDDEGARDLSGFGVGLGDDAAVAHGGMSEQNRFDFGGSDGESLVLDHLLDAVEDIVEAVGI